MHFVVELGPYFLFIPRSGLNTTTESLSGPKAFVPEKRRPAMDGEPFFSSISILPNPAKFHANSFFHQPIWNEYVVLHRKEICLTRFKVYSDSLKHKSPLFAGISIEGCTGLHCFEEAWEEEGRVFLEESGHMGQHRAVCGGCAVGID